MTSQAGGGACSMAVRCGAEWAVQAVQAMAMEIARVASSSCKVDSPTGCGCWCRRMGKARYMYRRVTIRRTQLLAYLTCIRPKSLQQWVIMPGLRTAAQCQQRHGHLHPLSFGASTWRPPRIVSEGAITIRHVLFRTMYSLSYIRLATPC